ncbi:nucleoside-diphosphate sugar epimerase/dehydratase [Alphaproteobacteria bacterium]|nr:nucleoside-diphosphate sugar epimerase/dehydratase [Alphaproteobacteria bacterium]
MNKLSNRILYLPRNAKRALAIITDIGLCGISTWLAFVLRLEELILIKDFNFYPALISIIIAIPIFWIFGLYRTIFRYTGISIIFTILSSLFCYAILYLLVIGVYSIEGVPRSIGVLQPMLLFFAIISSRLGVKSIFTNNYNFKKIINKKNVLVYGAGSSGRQLVTVLETNPEFKVVGFLDDDVLIHRQVLLGKTIYSPLNLKEVVQTKDVDIVFLALPSLPRNERNKIIEILNKYVLRVKTLPSISEIVDGKITISDIKDFSINDLLNRDEVKPDINLLNKNINSQTVLVTGAGGSIGSELCRQIVRLKPNKLILLELNEFALYKIYEELLFSNKNLKIISLLANAQDQAKLEIILETLKVDTIYHAAAYKHVPLVEENICEGVKNNVFSTLAIAKASVAKKVSNLVFVSSDKAVRPTNIMGASKRLSELCIQAICNETRDVSTSFSIVRFGNVLESSGSVIPKFKQQIKEGGPVTLTHPDVTRYFMTVTEAAQLVIQAGAMGEKSEVFVLDMGKSIKIRDLVYKMIKLSGFVIKDSTNLKGDIEVKMVGLRPGEKLYEELLIGENPQKTYHKKIQKAQDPFIPYFQLKIDLDHLYALLEDNNIAEVKEILAKIVPTYKSNSKIVDHIYEEQLKLKIPPIIKGQENKVIRIKAK